MSLLKPLSVSNKNHRKGVFLLLFALLFVQLLYWISSAVRKDNSVSIVDDSFESLIQSKIDQENTKRKLKPFNANYITDYRAYLLGISSDELNRIEVYRSSGNFFNNIEEFQSIGGLSDSLKLILESYLIFPYKNERFKTANSIQKEIDINEVTTDELKKTKGIGDVYSKRIIAYRNSLGGFDSINQLYNVYGLDSVVVGRLKKVYIVK